MATGLLSELLTTGQASWNGPSASRGRTEEPRGRSEVALGLAPSTRVVNDRLGDKLEVYWRVNFVKTSFPN